MAAESRTDSHEDYGVPERESSFVAMFEAEMTRFVNGQSVVDRLLMKRQQDVIYGRILWKIDRQLKGTRVTPADQRRLKKDIRKQVIESSEAIIAKREQDLQLDIQMDDIYMQYVKHMHHEMETTPFMSREVADFKHGRLMEDTVNNWQDKVGKHRLCERLDQEYAVLWAQLQDVNRERTDRVHAHVAQMVQAYEKRMRVEFPTALKWKKLDRKHEEIMKKVLGMYHEHEDVKMVGHHLKPVEEGLVKQMNLLFEKMKEESQSRTRKGSVSSSPAEEKALIDDAVHDAHGFYRFFMQYRLIGYKAGAMEPPKVQAMHLMVEGESLIHLQLRLAHLSEQSHSAGRKSLMRKNREDLSHFALSFASKSEQWIGNKAINWTIFQMKRLGIVSDGKTFMDYCDIDEVEDRMIQLLECRVAQRCRGYTTLHADRRSEVRREVASNILYDMSVKRISASIIDSVRTEMMQTPYAT